MNIFFVDDRPDVAAQSLHNVHVIKMTLESAQILSTAAHQVRDWNDLPARTDMYKATHRAHPCVLWAASSWGNYRWLMKHFTALALEYFLRYEKVHASAFLLSRFDEVEKSWFREISFNEPPQCMPEEYRVPGDPVSAYRRYYLAEKMAPAGATLPLWKYRDPPSWVEGGL